jgi:hypothetical protein
MPDERAEQLYNALWDVAATMRGSVSAAAQIKRATALRDAQRRPLAFDGFEAEAVAKALVAVTRSGSD